MLLLVFSSFAMKSPKVGTTTAAPLALGDPSCPFFYKGIGHPSYMGSCICEFSAIALLLNILSLSEILTAWLVL
jgi:hypothetical protein